VKTHISTCSLRPREGWPPVHPTLPTRPRLATGAPSPNPPAPFTCPMPICARGTKQQRWCGATKPQLLEHLRAKHPDERVSSPTLRSIRTMYCPTCGVLRSIGGRNHNCQHRLRSQPHLPTGLPISPPASSSPTPPMGPPARHQVTQAAPTIPSSAAPAATSAVRTPLAASPSILLPPPRWPPLPS
jgi:hypothetical protein